MFFFFFFSFSAGKSDRKNRGAANNVRLGRLIRIVEAACFMCGLLARFFSLEKHFCHSASFGLAARVRVVLVSLFFVFEL